MSQIREIIPFGYLHNDLCFMCYSATLLCVTSFMQGNLFSRSRPEGEGILRSLRGSRDSASRNRFSVGPFSHLAAPCSSSMTSESEWERMGGAAGMGVAIQGERGDRGAWGKNTAPWSEPPSVMSRVFSSLCSCTKNDTIQISGEQSANILTSKVFTYVLL